MRNWKQLASPPGSRCTSAIRTRADELNDRPRKRLGFYNPGERLAEPCGLRGGSAW
jgi:hypothetical protein